MKAYAVLAPFALLTALAFPKYCQTCLRDISASRLVVQQSQPLAVALGAC